MGTNYYWESQPPCPTCARPYEGKHIGKSSAGWCFSLHVYPDDNIKDLADWQRLWQEGRIVNEYDEEISADRMYEIVANRSWKRDLSQPPHPVHGCTTWNEFLYRNHATFGPNGLLRHAIDGTYCIGNGNGTWDLIVGEFS